MTQAAVLKDMTDPLERFKTQIKGTGCDAIAGLEKIASNLEMKELAKQLKVVNDQFRSDTFKLIVVGPLQDRQVESAECDARQA